MLRRNRALVAPALATVAAIASTPFATAPAHAASPCRAISTPDSSGTVLLAGAYTTPGAVDVQLTCGAVRNGVTVALVQDELTGPVAVVHGTRAVGPGSVTSCYVLRVVYLDRPSTLSDTCP